MPERFEDVALTLWSPLQRQLAALRQERAPAAQWVGILGNLLRKGVSQAELSGSGLLGWLQRLPPERVLPRTLLLGYLEERSDCELVVQRRVCDDFAPAVRFQKVALPRELPAPHVRHGQPEVRMLHFREPVFGLCVWLHVQINRGLFGHHRYWTLSLPHGRKKLSALPPNKTFVSAAEAVAAGRRWVERVVTQLRREGFVGGAKPHNRYGSYVLPGGAHYTEWLITTPYLSVHYENPHFDIANLLAHVRTTERMSAEPTTRPPRRVLLLEEIQSDWCQELRNIELDDDPSRELPCDTPPPNPYRHHWVEAALRLMLLLAAKKGFDVLAWLPGELQAERFPWANEYGLTMFYNQVVPTAVKKLAKVWGAAVGSVEIDTTTRDYVVDWNRHSGRWQLRHVPSQQWREETFDGPEWAENFRATQERAAREALPCLVITPAMRADLIRKGLPRLGAVTAGR